MTSQGFGKTKPQIVSSYLLRSKVDRKDELWGWKWTKDLIQSLVKSLTFHWLNHWPKTKLGRGSIPPLTRDLEWEMTSIRTLNDPPLLKF